MNSNPLEDKGTLYMDEREENNKITIKKNFNLGST